MNQRCGTHQCNRKLLTNTKELALTISSNTGQLETLGKEAAEGEAGWKYESIYIDTANLHGKELVWRRGRVCGAWRNSLRQQSILL